MTGQLRDAVFQPEFREDLRFWVDTDRRTALRILTIVEAVMREPFTGIGKPEPLKYLGAGTWSRRITQEHRLVSVVSDSRISPDTTTPRHLAVPRRWFFARATN